MTNEGDGASSTPNVCTDGCKKNKKGKNKQTGNKPNRPGLPPNVPPPRVLTPSEGQTSLPPQIVDESDVDTDEESVDVTVGPDWIARVEMARQAVEIIGQRLKRTDRNLKLLKSTPLRKLRAYGRSLRHASDLSTRKRRPLLP